VQETNSCSERVKSLPVLSQTALSMASAPERVQQLCGKKRGKSMGELSSGDGLKEEKGVWREKKGGREGKSCE